MTGVRSALSSLGMIVVVGIARADFVPIALTSGSYNRDVVVENTAPAPVIASGYTTASMDNGVANSGFNWYEQGYNTAIRTTGLPQPVLSTELSVMQRTQVIGRFTVLRPG